MNKGSGFRGSGFNLGTANGEPEIRLRYSSFEFYREWVSRSIREENL